MQLTRQLPGISFRVETPELVELPRMDVAAFVGFAPLGPLDTPVPVESYREFVDIFGGTYRLAWDDEIGTWQTACLAPAVKAFFTQGGRRCWIVRVAGGQVAVNLFPIAGLLQSNILGYRGLTAEARSPGSWSDAIETAAVIQMDPLTFTSAPVLPGSSFMLSIGSLRGQPIQTGDMLQLDFTDGSHRAYVVIGPEELQADSRTSRVTAVDQRTYWFHRVKAEAYRTLSGTVHSVSPAPPGSAPGTLDVEAMSLVSTMTAAPGDWLRFETAGGRIWLLVKQERGDTLHIASAWWEGFDAAGALSVAQLHRVQMALQVRAEPDQYHTLSGLAFAAPHPRFTGYLPDDATLFEPSFGQSALPLDNRAAALWDEVTAPRFPLSFSLDEEQVVIPLGLDGSLVWRDSLQSDVVSLVRDGLAPDDGEYEDMNGETWSNFITDLFIDPELRNTGQSSLITEANDRYYIMGEALTGLHALLPVTEASMIALPDAAQRGWVLTQPETQEPKAKPVPEDPPDPCAQDTPFASKTSEPEAEDEDAPEVENEGEDEAIPYELPEVKEKRLWKLVTPVVYEAGGLHSVQSAVAKLAAARGDMVAVLGMPKHYRTPDVLQHQRQLVADLRSAGATTDSYVALYHPWLVTREESGDLIVTHPAGGVCGVMAARAIDRGAWVAPANESIREALATIPVLAMEDNLAFYSVGINPIIQGARDFVIWGGLTQSNDPDLEAINVRRLLILLRRLALVEGEKYVFAPHSPAFRRRVQQQFEQRLSRLFARGAFAGRDPSEAYRVVIDETLNTPASVEQGRLIVELRVAPSKPITFITVRLVQLESGPLAVQEITSNVG